MGQVLEQGHTLGQLTPALTSLCTLVASRMEVTYTSTQRTGKWTILRFIIQSFRQAKYLQYTTAVHLLIKALTLT